MKYELNFNGNNNKDKTYTHTLRKIRHIYIFLLKCKNRSYMTKGIIFVNMGYQTEFTPHINKLLLSAINNDNEDEYLSIVL